MKSFNPAIGISILLVVVTILGVVAVILYRRKINKALQGEQSSAHTSLPAPADTVGGLYKAVVLILLIFRLKKWL